MSSFQEKPFQEKQRKPFYQIMKVAENGKRLWYNEANHKEFYKFPAVKTVCYDYINEIPYCSYHRLVNEDELGKYWKSD